MLKKQTHIIQFVSSLTFLVLLGACHGEKTSKQQVSCFDECLIMKNEQVHIEFNTQYIVVEQQYQLKIKSKEPIKAINIHGTNMNMGCLLYTSPSPRDRQKSRMPSSA